MPAETVLIADYEAAVRACIRPILGAAGFSVLELNPAVATAKTGHGPLPQPNCLEGSCPQTDDVRRSWKLLAVNASQRLPVVQVPNLA
jgi:hypothetical protein